MNEPTNSQTSAPSKHPIGTSKSSLSNFFNQGLLSLNNIPKIYYYKDYILKYYKDTENGKLAKIAKQLSVDDRIEQMCENESYITIKDHKEDFPNKISCRLINSSKFDIGKINKTILDKIITKIVFLTNVNQWKNSTSVTEWYKTIPNKNQYRFVMFDIESFYPSISLELFNETLNFVKNLTDISETDVSIVMQARKTLLFNDSKPWLKKFVNKDFNVPMGCFDGAEVCELVGSFISKKLCDVLQRENVRLYCDEGLAIIVQQMPGPELERKRKKIIETFKKYGLAVTIKANLFLSIF